MLGNLIKTHLRVNATGALRSRGEGDRSEGRGSQSNWEKLQEKNSGLGWRL